MAQTEEAAQTGRPIPKTRRASQEQAGAPSIPPSDPKAAKAATGQPPGEPSGRRNPSAQGGVQRSGPKREDDDSSKEGFSEKDVYYMLKDVREGFVDMQSRLDRIEENQASFGGQPVSDMPSIPGGVRFKSLKERAAWESQGAALARETSRAVSASRTRADQQSHTLGILEELAYLGDLADEKFLSFAALINEKWILDHSKREKSYLPMLTRIAEIVVIGVLGFAIIEGLVQPQNFQYVLNGLGEPRNLAIVIAAVSIFAGVFAFVWFRERRKNKMKPGGAQ